MAFMTIRNIDEAIMVRPRVRAAMHGRSTEDEAGTCRAPRSRANCHRRAISCGASLAMRNVPDSEDCGITVHEP